MVYGRDASSLPPSEAVVHPLRRRAWRMGRRCRWWRGGARGVAGSSVFAGAVSGAKSIVERSADSPLGVTCTEKSTASTNAAPREPLGTVSDPVAIVSGIGNQA